MEPGETPLWDPLMRCHFLLVSPQFLLATCRIWSWGRPRLGYPTPRHLWTYGPGLRGHMGQHIQRKRFDHAKLAMEAANGFKVIDPSIPGAKVTAEVVDVDGELWVYVTSEGEMVTGEEPLLPDYERVG
jgi:hypothetical protein